MTRIARRPLTWVLLVVLAATAGAEAKGKTKYKDEFEAFRKHVDKTYPFFDLKGIRKDWKKAKKTLAKRAAKCKSDGDFVLVVADAIKVLRDGHMRMEVKEGVEVDWPSYWHSGLALAPADGGKVVVLAAPPGRETTLPPGTVVTKIDGKPARKHLDKLAAAKWDEGGGFSSPQRARFFTYRTALVGEKGEKHTLTYLDGKRSKEVTLRNQHELRNWMRAYNQPQGMTQGGKSLWHTRLESGVGYMWWRRIDGSIQSGIAAALEACPKTKGWILDLRANTGGGYNNALIEQIKQIPKPVAVIIDAGCISAGETMIRDLVNIHDARVFGTTSAGSSSSKEAWSFPSGIAKVIYSTRTRTGLDGKGIEFNGITPHEVVEPVPEEVRAGKNTEILRAEAWLLKQ
ncbi:MAG: S41 family peptidase [Planctomycetota bacterium]|nr:S41 family peptidase [Planctomycetota bacterium]